MVADSFYGWFVELYNDLNIRVPELIEEMCLTQGEYTRLREKALKCGDIIPRTNQTSNTKHYYYNEGYYKVRRMIGDKLVFFGSFKEKETAARVVEMLEECNWDKTQMSRIKREVMK